MGVELEQAEFTPSFGTASLPVETCVKRCFVISATSASVIICSLGDVRLSSLSTMGLVENYTCLNGAQTYVRGEVFAFPGNCSKETPSGDGSAAWPFEALLKPKSDA